MNDTVRLLRECNSGIKMGESALEKVIGKAQSCELVAALNECKGVHAELGDRTHSMLLHSGADTKDPHVGARMMSDARICMAMAIRKSDRMIANLMTNGCNMGVKSIFGYLNRYEKANPEARDIAMKLIESELVLEEKLRRFL